MKRSISQNKGFTLIEVLIALTLLSIGILGISGLAGTAIKSSSYSRALTQANNLAQERLEMLLSVPFDNIQVTDNTTLRMDLRRTCTGPTAGTCLLGLLECPVYTCTLTTPTITLDDKDFTWSYTVTYIDTDANGIASPGVDGLKRIDLTVSWTDQLWHTTKSFIVTTLRTVG